MHTTQYCNSIFIHTSSDDGGIESDSDGSIDDCSYAGDEVDDDNEFANIINKRSHHKLVHSHSSETLMSLVMTIFMTMTMIVLIDFQSCKKFISLIQVLKGVEVPLDLGLRSKGI